MAGKLFVSCLIVFIIITPAKSDKNKNLYLGVLISLFASFLGAIFLITSDIILKRDKIKNVKEVLWNNFFFSICLGYIFHHFCTFNFWTEFIRCSTIGIFKGNRYLYFVIIIYPCKNLLDIIYWRYKLNIS